MQTKEETARKKREYMKVYHKQNKEKHNKQSKAYYEENKDQARLNNKAWSEANPDKVKEYANNWYHKNKAKDSTIVHYLLKHAKARAKKKNVPYSLLPEDISIPTHCPILKKPFIKNDPKYSYSLDRKDPAKGYIKENVWVISKLANAMKWDSTREERLLFALWVRVQERETDGFGQC